MGLLDDAIREHLDLQRRRGADPTEVERAERDALGPVRRGPAEPLESAYDQHGDEEWDDERLPAAVAGDDLYEDDEPFEDEFEFEAGADPDRARRDTAPGSGSGSAEPAAPRQEPLRPEPNYHLKFQDQELPSAPRRAPDPFDESDPEPPPPRAGSPPVSPMSDETMQYDVEGEAMHEEESRGKADEDTLEETPDFLQDTPDHDRLWFEQRPPRDFDFDG